MGRWNHLAWGEYVDLAIPDGAQVVGSGLLINAIETSSGTYTAADDLTPTELANLSGISLFGVFTGPCPVDDTKWRVMLLNPGTDNPGNQVHVTAWITTLQTLTTTCVVAVS